MTFSLEAEVLKATDDWKLAHGWITFADVPLGEEFVDEHGNTWEKRERYSFSWIQGEQPEFADFAPDEPVRLK